MTRRALFGMLAAAILPLPLTSPRSKWGGIQAYWLDEGPYLVGPRWVRLYGSEVVIPRTKNLAKRGWRITFNVLHR